MGNQSGAGAGEPGRRPVGVLVIGDFESGVEPLALSLSNLVGQPVPGTPDHLPELTRFNDRLLAELGGSVDSPPDISLSDLVYSLHSFVPEARAAFSRAFGATPGADAEPDPWVWGDPRNAVLAPFWMNTLGEPTLAVLVHRTPSHLLDTDGGESERLRRWERFNKSALNTASAVPTLVVGFDDLRDNPVDVRIRFSKFCAEAHLNVDTWQEPEAFKVALAADAQVVELPTSSHLPPATMVLHQLLEKFEDAPSDPFERGAASAEIVDEISRFYDADYYAHYGSGQDQMAYSREGSALVGIFENVAERIVETINPRRHLDVGCAIGLLVESLRDRGVDSWGMDVSEWAISQVPEPLRPYCSVGSITDEIVGEFDLITCIEVLEHLPRALAEPAVSNLCRHTDAVLISSTPDDFDDATHLNVESAAYWSNLFLLQGFLRDTEANVTFIAPQAVLYRRSGSDVSDVIDGYERLLQSTRSTLTGLLGAAVAEHDALAERYNELAIEINGPGSDGVGGLQARLNELEARRQAEGAAAGNMLMDFEHRWNGMAHELERVRLELAKANEHIEGIHRTRMYRYSWKLRKLYFLRRTAQRDPKFVVADTRAATPPHTASYEILGRSQ